MAVHWTTSWVILIVSGHGAIAQPENDQKNPRFIFNIDFKELTGKNNCAVLPHPLYHFLGVLLIMRYILAGFAALLCLFTFSPAQADTDLFSVSAGYYDINDNEEAVDFRLEYRWDDPLVWVVKPWVGIEATSEAAFYGVAGLLLDFQIADNFLITPSFGVGAYEDGDGKDLGHTLEFRSQLELGYKFENMSRIGVAFGHI